VQGRPVLPAAAQLEMARAALAQALELEPDAAQRLQLQDVVFARLLVVDAEPRSVHITLEPGDSGVVAFEIHSGSDDEALVHSRGRAALLPAAEAPQLDLQAALAQCTSAELSGEACYEAFARGGLAYGPAHRALAALHAAHTEAGVSIAIGTLRLPEVVAAGHDQYVLHPSLLDAALQATAGMQAADAAGVRCPSLPYALERLDLFAPCPPAGFAVVRDSGVAPAGDGVRKLDVDLCDEQGRVCVRLAGFSMRALKAPAASDEAAVLRYEECWAAQPLDGPAPFVPRRVVCWLSDAAGRQQVAQALAAWGAGIATVFIECEGNADACAQALRRVHDEHGPVDALLYLRPLEDCVALRDLQAIAALVQGLSSSGLQCDRLLLAGASPRPLDRCHLDAWIGFERSLRQLLPRTRVAVIAGSDEAPAAEAISRWMPRLRAEMASDRMEHVFYEGSTRQVLRLLPAEPGTAAAPLRDAGTYLITGGLGGLGWLFAQHLARTRSARLVLTGRSALDAAKQQRLDALQAAGGEAMYLAVDVADQAAMRAAIETARGRFGAIHGVIHAAGIGAPHSVLQVSREAFAGVLAPKVEGTLVLDEVLRGQALDFICHFSSAAAVLGDFGACSYAVGNRFQAAHARWCGGPASRVLAIQWPLWEEGGLGLGDAPATQRYLQASGQRALRTPQGLALFEQLLGGSPSRPLVLTGDPARIERFLRVTQGGPVALAAPAVPAAAGALEQRAARYLAGLLSQTLRMPAERIDPQAAFEQYGIDSVMVMELTSALERSFGPLSKTLFFEHQSLQALASYFVEEQHDKLTAVLGTEAVRPAPPVAAAAVPPAPARRTRQRFAAVVPAANAGALDIAIIGLSGRYPKAATVQEFWDRLAGGEDCVSEIPTERWDQRLHFDPEKGKLGKSYARWGGFIDGVDRFDALFFNIAPRDAAGIDPQDRLFLQCAQATLEDAGHTRDTLGRSVGVFVGAMYQEYQLYGAQAQALGSGYALGGNSSAIANRVSYFFNFHGPSLAVDTMCSSSLTAIHLACQSIARGDCEVALAGGVNLSVHPNKFIALSQGQFLSTDGRCRSFGAGGDGYVPGEGVGAVLLKPLARAIEDGDRIHGVIKASAINHGGKTNGYTVPNPNAQAELIERAIRQAGIPAAAISYIEAHGTGTALGDPIEIAGLAKAFGEVAPGRCAIGSAKSNIGHCESAAGIAGLTKVLLQMKHATLVKSLHSDELNPNIDFQHTPFVVQRERGPWKRPVVEHQGQHKEYPRIAGISSFGAGGANAHLIVQEYEGPRQVPRAPAIPPLIVLSARNEEQVKERAQQLLQALRHGDLDDAGLAGVAYTLQVGREAMDARLGLRADSPAQAIDKLERWLAGRPVDGLHQGHARRQRDALASNACGEDRQPAANADSAQGRYEPLLDAWVKGAATDWRALHGDAPPRRVGLPTYPFARDRHWVPVVRALGVGAATDGQGPLHPLLHRNTSTMEVQRFSARFRGDELFLAHHVVQGQRVLPGVAQLEMVRAAVERSMPSAAQRQVQLKNVVWSRPIVVREQPLDVHVELRAQDDGTLAYEISSGVAGGEALVHGQGLAKLQAATEPPPVDLARVKLQCAARSVSGDHCYRAFAAMGLVYGPAHQGLRSLQVGQDDDGRVQALARWALPEVVAGQAHGLHPSVLDAALQASVGLDLDRRDTRPWLPFALESLEPFGPTPAEGWAWVRHGGAAQDGVRKVDIDVLDDEGRVCVRMRGFHSRVLDVPADAQAHATGPQAPARTLLLAPRWQAQPAPAVEPPAFAQRWVVLSEALSALSPAVEASMPGVGCETLGAEGGLAARYEAATIQLLALLQVQLQTRPSAPVLVQLVVPMQGEAALCAGLSGLFASARKESPKLICQVIQVEADTSAAQLVVLLNQNAAAPDAMQVRHAGQARQLVHMEALAPSTGAAWRWRDGGVYLITGGAGGLGSIFARDIAQSVQAPVLVLTGRSPLDAARQAQLDVLRSLGARATYRQADVADALSVRGLIDGVLEEFGALHGVLHAAGVIRDSFLVKKTTQEVSAVLAPKVAALVALDEATSPLALDCFVLFSSVAGVFGNVGQADYAAGNGFMDAYAHHRHALVQAGQRQGRTLSVNWPLWAEGGMGVDTRVQEHMRLKGLQPLATAAGVQALHDALVADVPQVVVLAGEPPAAKESPAPPPADLAADEGLAARLQAALVQAVSALLKVDAGEIEAEAELTEYGFDSISFTQLANQLNRAYRLELAPTVFFEHTSVGALARYLVHTHAPAIEAVLAPSPAGAAGATAASADPGLPQLAGQVAATAQGARFTRPAPAPSAPARPQPGRDDAVAIIGFSGRFPQAETLQALWDNLRAGKDCIVEIPPQRWPLEGFYEADVERALAQGKSYSKWGGFIDDVDRFDAAFFGVPAREAAAMDPQERLFLQTVWHLLESAGYTRESVQQRHGAKVGVYVGSMYHQYRFDGADPVGAAVAATASHGAIANRCSHFFGFEGPSIAIDTMSSSSLVAIHQACKDLLLGECQLAVAGGVNLSIDPKKYIAATQAQIVGSHADSRSFANGDGYLPAEAVAAVLLKPLARAVADGDSILAVIRSTATSHSGRSSGYFVPSLHAQARLIEDSLAKAGIEPHSIGCVEAAAHGSSLGDAIELMALDKVFCQSTPQRRFCTIGSVKSNLGHAEAASAMTQLAKVVLQLRHGQLVPSIKAERLNPNLDFEHSAFRLQRELSDWPRLSVPVGGCELELPRRAMINSFGAGGSYANMIVEEYVPAERDPVRVPSAEPRIIVLSARDRERLAASVQQMLEHIEHHDELALADIAYTLQTAREAMECRWAFVAPDRAQLLQAMRSFVAVSAQGGDAGSAPGHVGDADDQKKLRHLLSGAAGEALLGGLLAEREPDKLAAWWAQGGKLPWELLQQGGAARRVELPGYPFARGRFWLSCAQPGALPAAQQAADMA
jgi:polyketide synthase PksN